MPLHQASPAVEARDLCRRFGRRWALARVDLSVQRGERLLIIGANGSGKTTLLRLISTALRPSRGELRILGIDTAGDLTAARRGIALLSHQTGLYEDLSARDNLRVLARLCEREVDAAALLARVGLDDRPGPVRAYSAGMRKRLQFAALLLQEPELALLDEPYSALDPQGMADISALIRALPGTVIVVSHQVRRAAEVCDRAVLLDGGLTRWEGPAEHAWHAWCLVHRPTDLPAARTAG